MNMTVYIEDQLATQLSKHAEKLHRKRNSIVREAIKDWLNKNAQQKWSNTVLKFKGIEDFPDVDELRKSVVESKKELF